MDRLLKHNFEMNNYCVVVESEKNLATKLRDNILHHLWLLDAKMIHGMLKDNFEKWKMEIGDWRISVFYKWAIRIYWTKKWKENTRSIHSVKMAIYWLLDYFQRLLGQILILYNEVQLTPSVSRQKVTISRKVTIGRLKKLTYNSWNENGSKSIRRFHVFGRFS